MIVRTRFLNEEKSSTRIFFFGGRGGTNVLFVRRSLLHSAVQKLRSSIDGDPVTRHDPWFDKKEREEENENLKISVLRKIPYRVIINILGYLLLEVNCAGSYNFNNRDLIRLFFGYFRLDYTRKPFNIFESVFLKTQRIFSSEESGHLIYPKSMKTLVLGKGYGPNFRAFRYLEKLTIREQAWRGERSNKVTPFICQRLQSSHPKLKELDLDVTIGEYLPQALLVADNETGLEFPKNLRTLRIQICSDVLLQHRSSNLFKFPWLLEKLRIHILIKTKTLMPSISSTNILIRQLLTHPCFEKMECWNLKDLTISFGLTGRDFVPKEANLSPCYSRTFHFLKQFRRLENLEITTTTKPNFWRGFDIFQLFVVLTGDEICDLYEIPSLKKLSLCGVGYREEFMDRKFGSQGLRRSDLSIRLKNLYFVKPEARSTKGYSFHLKDFFHLPEVVKELNITFDPSSTEKQSLYRYCKPAKPNRKVIVEDSSLPELQKLCLSNTVLPADFYEYLPQSVEDVKLELCVLKTFWEPKRPRLRKKRKLRSYRRIVLDKVGFRNMESWEKFFGLGVLESKGKVEMFKKDRKYHGKGVMKGRRFRIAGKTVIDVKEVVVWFKRARKLVATMSTDWSCSIVRSESYLERFSREKEVIVKKENRRKMKEKKRMDQRNFKHRNKFPKKMNFNRRCKNWR